MINENLIRHWANLFESEEDMRDGGFLPERENGDKIYNSFFENEGIYGALRIGDFKNFGERSAFIYLLYYLTRGSGVYVLKHAIKTKWGIGLIEVARKNGFEGTDEEILEDILDNVWEHYSDTCGEELVKKLTSVDGVKSLRDWIKKTCGMSDMNWFVCVDGIDPVPLTSRQFSDWMNGNDEGIDFLALDKKYGKNPLQANPDLQRESTDGQVVNPSDIDMNAIAAPILEKYNSERKPDDTWEYVAEYLEADTFIVNANGLCQTKEAFDRRDEIVYDIAKEIETAANESAGIDPDDDDTWHCCEHCYWDEDGEEVDDDPDETDWDDDIPIWKKIVTSQEMICCHL